MINQGKKSSFLFVGQGKLGLFGIVVKEEKVRNLFWLAFREVTILTGQKSLSIFFKQGLEVSKVDEVTNFCPFDNYFFRTDDQNAKVEEIY